MKNKISKIVITAGEPAGIGPDIVLQLAQQAFPAEIVVVASKTLLEQRAKQLNLPIKIKDYDSLLEPKIHHPGELVLLDHSLKEICEAGHLNPLNAVYVLNTLHDAIIRCLNKEFDALVTAPVHKGCINKAGIHFTGHTEYLAEITNTPFVVMMLVAEKLRVALVTTHLPLAAVAAAITSEKIEKTLQILHQALKVQFHIDNPCILVCGLNPHAGEQGHLGREEIEIIEPILKKFQQKGFNIKGPLPADTIFTPPFLKQADAILAMYHDQGLPVLKQVGFGRAVNVTLGLPIIRTSVDHGTALDLAGTGRADAGSLRAAVLLAIELANKTATT